MEINGGWLLIPFFVIRFGILLVRNRDAIKRAAYFPPRLGMERIAYWIYQISNTAIFVYLFFLTIVLEWSWWFCTGLILLGLGMVFCTISMIHFAAPSPHGFHTNGVYRLSRNPMYVSYFVYFASCAFLTKSYILGVVVTIFQISAHWIILSEERWCRERFGEAYVEYSKRVRRYFGRERKNGC